MLAMYGAKRTLFRRDLFSGVLRHIYLELFIVQVVAFPHTVLLFLWGLQLLVASASDTSMVLTSSNQECMCAFVLSHGLS